MKIIVFEAGIYSLSRVLLEGLFPEFGNQASYNLFGNKPSCGQGQYQNFVYEIYVIF